jgi:fatty acid desaturase
VIPVAIAVERTELPESLRAQVRPLKGPRPARFVSTLVLNWLIIAATIAAAVHLNRWWATLPAIAIVATRQGVLALLVHEQVHLVAFRNRFGDLLANLFCAFPLLFWTTEGYAQVHLGHHGHYFVPGRDPDLQRKGGPEWEFPKPPWSLAVIALRDLLGLNFVKTFVTGKRTATVEFARPGINPRWVRPLFLLALATALTVVGGWKIFLLYWLVPMLTVLQLRFRWGALVEHQYNRPGAGIVESTPLVVPRWWQRILLPDLNFYLHIHHHHFPSVSFGNLPRVHQIFVAHGLVHDQAIFHGLGAYLRFLTRQP